MHIKISVGVKTHVCELNRCDADYMQTGLCTDNEVIFSCNIVYIHVPMHLYGLIHMHVGVIHTFICVNAHVCDHFNIC